MNRNKGFTLIELLTVIGVIALLAAILIPTVGRVRDSAKNTQSRAQFSQWITAIEMFRTEYGYWPDFNSDGPDWDAKPLTDGNLIVRLREPLARTNFFEFLSGRHANGDRFEPEFRYEKHPNRRRISFYDFTEGDYEFVGNSGQIDKTASNVELVDSFGNNDILIVMDGDRDGIIKLKDSNDYKVHNELSSKQNVPAPGVAPYGSNAPQPYKLTGAERDVRASIIIYSPGKQAQNRDEAYEHMIRTW